MEFLDLVLKKNMTSMKLGDSNFKIFFKFAFLFKKIKIKIILTMEQNILKLAPNESPNNSVSEGEVQSFFYLQLIDSFKQIDKQLLTFLGCLHAIRSKSIQKRRLRTGFISDPNDLLLHPSIQPLDWEEVKQKTILFLLILTAIIIGKTSLPTNYKFEH